MWQKGGIQPFYKGLSTGLIGIFPYAAIDLATFETLKAKITERNMRLYGLEREDAKPSSGTKAIIGAFAGAFGASVVYPLNLLRTRLQSQGTASHPRTYTGLSDAFVQTMKGEGIPGLFKGLGPNLVKVVPAVSIVSSHSSFPTIDCHSLTSLAQKSYVVYENAKKSWDLE